VNEVLGVELPDTEWDTVGGLVFNLLGHVPDPGETVRFQGLEFRTEQVEGRRIVLVAIVPVAGAGGEEGRAGANDHQGAPERAAPGPP
jgi:CBS domain containing-hemolysin-like protein